ncbi:MAG TPA: hypothetical protein VGK74_02350 [Symbiobacteriaceae bacterium]
MTRMSRWFRFYDDFFHHPKTKRLNGQQRLVVIGAWSIASRSPTRGVLLLNKDLAAEPIDIANEIELPLQAVIEALGTMQEPGPVTRRGMFLEWREDGVLIVPNWNERQFVDVDPTNAERQKRYRDAHPEAKPKRRNAPVTENNALHQPLQDRYRNAPDYRLQIPKDIAEEEEEEGVRERLKTLPEELRDNWGRAYQYLCVKDASASDTDVLTKFQKQAGITDQLIVMFIERAIQKKRRNYLTWVAEVLTECAANEIRTPEEYAAFEAERDAGGNADAGRTASGPGPANGASAAKRPDGSGRKAPGTPAPNTGGNPQSSVPKPSVYDSLCLKG